MYQSPGDNVRVGYGAVEVSRVIGLELTVEYSCFLNIVCM